MNDRHAVVLEILSLSNCLSRGLGSLNAERSSAGISSVNAQILGYLMAHQDEDIFQRDIEEAFSIRRSTVSKVVGLMERKGLLLREPVAQDGRLKRLVITDKARQIHAVAASEFADFEQRATQNLSDQEILTLKHLLGKISINLKSEDEEKI